MKILSLHYGFSLGGVATYAKKIEKINGIGNFSIHSLCVLDKNRIVDNAILAQIDHSVVVKKNLYDLSWIINVLKFCSAFNPDVVISHGFNGHLVNLICRVFSRKSFIQLASYHGDYHATTPMRRLLQPLYNWFTRWFVRTKAVSTVCVADFCLNFLIERGVSARNLVTIHNGITDYTPQFDTRQRIRDEWGIQSDELLIGCASRLDPVKGLLFLVDAFATINSRHDSVRLVIIGDGTLRHDLEAKVVNLGLSSKVVFTGMRSDVPDCLTALDIFVIPSLAEYHSFGLLEAMRASLAIIATDVGGNTESVRDGLEALIVPPANSHVLKDALLRLLNDKSLRETLSVSAKNRFLQHFTEEAMVQKFGDWLLSVMEKNP